MDSPTLDPTPARSDARSCADPRDRVVDDPAVVLFAERLAYELLGDGDGKAGHLTAQLIARPPDVGVGLRTRCLDKAPRFDLCRLDERALFLRGFLQRLRADRRRFLIGAPQTGRVLLLLSCRFGARGLGLLQRL